MHINEVHIRWKTYFYKPRNIWETRLYWSVGSWWNSCGEMVYFHVTKINQPQNEWNYLTEYHKIDNKRLLTFTLLDPLTQWQQPGGKGGGGMCVYWLNLSYFVQFQLKTSTFFVRFEWFSSISHNNLSFESVNLHAI